MRIVPLSLACLTFGLGCLDCRSPSLAGVEATWMAEPSSLEFGPVYVGFTGSSRLLVRNLSRGKVALALHVSPPFEAAEEAFSIAGGDSVEVEVRFKPSAAGDFAAPVTLSDGERQVISSARGEGLLPPVCTAASTCHASHFEPRTAACIEAPSPDGAPCQSECLAEGAACRSGRCEGRPRTCDDGDACTLDTCEVGAGCRHQDMSSSCPAASEPCQAASCRPDAGCGFEPAIDGTLCGPDVCAATQVSICLGGQCVERARPATARCANTWVPAYLPGRGQTAVAFDAARRRVLLFGGASGNTYLSDTWEWDGTLWVQRTPPTSPPPRSGHTLAYDSARQRVVLFGGLSRDTSGFVRFTDTWEWDGTTWLERTPLTSPRASTSHAMAYDAARRRVVLFGGSDGSGIRGETWEWDGRSWADRTPLRSPPGRLAAGLAYDEARQRVLLFGGTSTTGNAFSDTWEWDGTTWTRRTPLVSPPGRSRHSLVYDAALQRVVLIGGVGISYLSDVWDWDGTNWVQRSPAVFPSHRALGVVAYDAARQRLVHFGGLDGGGGHLAETWEWDGAAWVRRDEATPPTRYLHTLTYDADRQRAVLFGGLSGTASADTWEWDGTRWAQLAPSMTPPARYGHAATYDAARQRVVLFGGWTGGAYLSDTWEWDGTTWRQQFPTGSPLPRERHALAYDANRQRVVLFGGWTGGMGGLSDTWEWDGTTWTQRAVTTSPTGRSHHALVYDAARQRVVLFGGMAASASFSDTWEWDGIAWAEKTLSTSPPGRSHHALAYDGARQRVLLFGGYHLAAEGRLSDTWEWDGTAWVQRAPVASPPARYMHAAAYDAASQRVVLFGGEAGRSASDTWLFLP